MTSPLKAWRSAAGGSRKIGPHIVLSHSDGAVSGEEERRGILTYRNPSPTLIALYEALMQEER